MVRWRRMQRHEVPPVGALVRRCEYVESSNCWYPHVKKGDQLLCKGWNHASQLVLISLVARKEVHATAFDGSFWEIVEADDEA